jgi:hypothetical protein
MDCIGVPQQKDATSMQLLSRAMIIGLNIYASLLARGVQALL